MQLSACWDRSHLRGISHDIRFVTYNDSLQGMASLVSATVLVCATQDLIPYGGNQPEAGRPQRGA